MFGKYNKHIIRVVLGIIVIGFIALTVLISIFPQSFIDLEFSEEIQEHQNPFLDGLMKVVSWFGYFPGSVIVVAVAILLLLIYKYKREALFVFFTAFAGLISTVVKLLVNRPRPTEQFVRIVRKVTEQSFPSGHVLFYITFFGFLTVLMYRLKSISHPLRISVGIVSMLLIFLVPFSRIYLGAHWFTDVLGGFLLGVLYLYLLCFFYFKTPAQ